MNKQTYLYRQVHPSWIQEGRITSQTFTPTPKDQGRLSVYNGDLITPSKAWKHYTTKLQCLSAGVVGVTVKECEDQSLQPLPDPEPFPEHAVIDFSSCSSNREIKKKAKVLRNLAEKRGWLYLAAEL